MLRTCSVSKRPSGGPRQPAGAAGGGALRWRMDAGGSRPCCSSARCRASAGEGRWHPLPDGIWFLQEDSGGPVFYGEGFVMTPANGASCQERQQPQQPGLVLYQASGRQLSLTQRPRQRRQQHQKTGLALQQRAPAAGGGGLVRVPRVPLVMVPVEAEETGIVPFGWDFEGGESTGIVPYGWSFDDGCDAAAAAQQVGIVPYGWRFEDGGGADAPPPTQGAGLVPAPQEPPPPPLGAGAGAGVPSGAAHKHPASWSKFDPAKNAYESFSSSPRRTHKVKFTCRRCGATSIRPINLNAWRTGTVFAVCGGCGIKHKLVDHLKLFHELSGPVYPTTPLAPPPPQQQQQQAAVPLEEAAEQQQQQRQHDEEWVGGGFELDPDAAQRLRLRLERLFQQGGGGGGGEGGELSP